MNRKAILKLKDGKEFEGIAFGADTGPSIGEAVFNTGIPGYQEILTDPSYSGQIVTLTSPMIGNYGITAGLGEQRGEGCGPCGQEALSRSCDGRPDHTR